MLRKILLATCKEGIVITKNEDAKTGRPFDLGLPPGQENLQFLACH
jgi:hypothetical protein